MIHKIAGLPGTLTLSVTSNLILSLNLLWLRTTSNNKCKNDVYNGYRRRSCTSKTAKNHRFVRF